MMRYFFSYNRPVSSCYLVTLAIIFYILGWISSRIIIPPTLTYLEVFSPPKTPTCPPPVFKNLPEGEEEHLFAGQTLPQKKATGSTPKNVKLFCMVLTAPEVTQEKAVLGVKSTWGRRCDKLVFISSHRNDSVPTVNCNCTEGYKNLWGKVKAGLIYVQQTFGSQFDWFLKADDDTYVVVENLKAQLERYDPDKPLFLGRRLTSHVPGGYMAGGAGYVLSRSGLKTLVEQALLKDAKGCRRQKELGIEDFEIGLCASAANVTYVDTRDPDDRLETFLDKEIRDILLATGNRTEYWQPKYNYYKSVNEGPECCSDRAATFHKVDVRMMHTLEYFIYRFKTNG